MKNVNAFAAAGVAAMPWTLQFAGAAAPVAHRAHAAHATHAGAAITPPRKRRTATAIVASVDRGTF